MKPVKVLIVDDQQLIREGISSLLILQKGIDVVGTATNGAEAVELYKTIKPDVILMDIRMPIMDGIRATEKILTSSPSCNILMLTTFDDEEYIIKSLKAGAKGYMMKDIPIEDLTRAIIQVDNGTFQLAPTVMEKLLEKLDAENEEKEPIDSEIEKCLINLTEREKDVLKLIAQGLTNREIAARLFLSEGTVKNYVSAILNSMNLRDRTQAALIAIKARWDKE